MQLHLRLYFIRTFCENNRIIFLRIVVQLVMHILIIFFTHTVLCRKVLKMFLKKRVQLLKYHMSRAIGFLKYVCHL